ncbi:MAG: DUF4258 domain-containing protein [Clostridiales bacterium]|nr:DUF4258 domain-containing protein [Clostridiales bacterium]
MIKIDDLRKHYQDDAVFITEHAAERARQRGILSRDIRSAVENGEIIEQYPDDYPFPSCLVLGEDEQGNSLHVCMSEEGNGSRIITAYYPDKSRWNDDLRTRRRDSI